jgi:murein DD-endopeptidase MepM/ murein hydrolase activator NlpD
VTNGAPEQSRYTEAAAVGALILLALAIARNARAGTLGAWLAAKFLNRGAPPVGELTAGATATGLGLAPTPAPLTQGGHGATRLTDPLPTGSTGDGFGVPRAGGTRTHKGIDLIAPCGTPFRAAHNGRVSTYSLSLCGIGMTVDDGHGTRTHYCHARNYAVTSGATVRAGQTIGYIGDTGDAVGCHLHFEVEIDGTKVDPAPYIGR